jgi:hypothetical protein
MKLVPLWSSRYSDTSLHTCLQHTASRLILFQPAPAVSTSPSSHLGASTGRRTLLQRRQHCSGWRRTAKHRVHRRTLTNLLPAHSSPHSLLPTCSSCIDQRIIILESQHQLPNLAAVTPELQQQLAPPCQRSGAQATPSAAADSPP